MSTHSAPSKTPKRLALTPGPRPLHLGTGTVPNSPLANAPLPRRMGSVAYGRDDMRLGFDDGVKRPGLTRGGSLREFEGRRGRGHASTSSLASGEGVLEQAQREAIERKRRSASAIDDKDQPPPVLTLAEKHKDLLHFIAQKEAKCVELRAQLITHEADLLQLKKKWEKIVAKGNDRQAARISTGNGAVDLLTQGDQATTYARIERSLDTYPPLVGLHRNQHPIFAFGRYPAHLSHGSPPRKPHLNSNQYETMEDLLAAAGYTVTRVFTPETERTQKMQEGQEEQGAGGAGIGTMFAGWIAHILPAATTSGTSRPTRPQPEVVQDVGSRFLTVQGSGNYPQSTRSLRAHLMSLALKNHPDPPHAQDQRTITSGSQPVLRHVTSAPSLPRVVSGRRRGLPSAWRDQPHTSENTPPPKAGWSGGFIPKQTEVLKSRGGKNWFGTVASDATLRARSGSQPPRASQTLRPPPIHRARSAPRLNKVHVPAPAPPVRPSPVVQPNVVVCRSVSNFGSSSSVQTPCSTKSRSKLSLQSDDEEPESPCLVLTPESAHPEGLPSTAVRPVLVKQRSARFLRRGTPQPPSVEEEEPEPDLASIITAFRPPSAPPSPARRQRSIRSLRALLKDPKFPDLPVVCVASPETVNAGGAGKAIWIRDMGWEGVATVRK